MAKEANAEHSDVQYGDGTQTSRVGDSRLTTPKYPTSTRLGTRGYHAAILQDPVSPYPSHSGPCLIAQLKTFRPPSDDPLRGSPHWAQRAPSLFWSRDAGGLAALTQGTKHHDSISTGRSGGDQQPACSTGCANEDPWFASDRGRCFGSSALAT